MKFTSVLKSIILEQSRFQVLMDKFVKKPAKRGEQPDQKDSDKTKIPKEIFFDLIKADPTSRLNNVEFSTANEDELNKVKVGSYVTWLIKRYLNVTTERQPGDLGYEQEVKIMRDRFMEDLYKVKENLEKFERFKGRLPIEKRNIEKLSVRELEELVSEFKLEKNKFSAEEKEKSKTNFEYPGSKIVFRGKNWTIVEIEGCNELAKDAACFFGGYDLKPEVGETHWCTSARGEYNRYYHYCKSGPLHVILPNQDVRYGDKTGLPANRYQFQFGSNQFMDKYDNPVDVIELLNGPMSELKNFFKPEFAKGLTSGSGTDLKIDDFKYGSVAKFVGLYGLEELFDVLPDTLRQIKIKNRGETNITLKIPKSITRFQNLQHLVLVNCIDELPDYICGLENLNILGVMTNPKLNRIPDCIATMKNLDFINFKDTSAQAPSSLEANGWTEMETGMWDKFTEDED